MTPQVSISDVARQARGVSIPTALAATQDLQSDVRPIPNDSRLGIIAAAVAFGARVCLQRFLDALHESRRTQAAIELARHRDLIYDPTTGFILWKHPPYEPGS